jgi:hypothetical protein
MAFLLYPLYGYLAIKHFSYVWGGRWVHSTYVLVVPHQVETEDGFSGFRVRVDERVDHISSTVRDHVQPLPPGVDLMEQFRP